MSQSGDLDRRVRGSGGPIARIARIRRQFDHPSPSACCRRKKGDPDHAIGRSRGGLSTKINALVDARRLPVRIVLSPDKAAVPLLFDGRRAGDVVADRGYDARAILELVAALGGTAHIPTCSDRRVQRSVDRELYRKRNLVERFFCKLKHFRRVATRYEKLAANYLAAVLLAATRLWMRFESMTPSPHAEGGLPIPHARPIKPVYIKKLVSLADAHSAEESKVSGVGASRDRLKEKGTDR